jgi:hypothetical protein
MKLYNGFVDEVSEELIRGWCDPPGHPSVYVNGILAGVAELAGLREDASPTACGFLFRPRKFLNLGLNQVRIVFPDGVDNHEATIVFLAHPLDDNC